MSITFYHANPASHSSVRCTSAAGTDESIAQLREILAHAIALSGRDHWLWSPGALISMHADADGALVAVWRDQKALVKYHRYISQAWGAVFGERSDVEHIIDGPGNAIRRSSREGATG